MAFNEIKIVYQQRLMYAYPFLRRYAEWTGEV